MAGVTVDVHPGASRKQIGAISRYKAVDGRPWYTPRGSGSLMAAPSHEQEGTQFVRAEDSQITVYPQVTVTRKVKAASAPGKFVFRRHLSVGFADALEDEHYLKQSFVDTGELSILRDVSNPQAIVVGRTGAGKTALLSRLGAIEERVISLVPQDLALTYVANSTVLQFFTELGVNLDLFYQLLWRHVISVELLRRHFSIIDDRSRDGVLQRLRTGLFGKSAKQEALDYLLEWGTEFWKETDYRVKEITKTMESDLSRAIEGSISASMGFATGKVTAGAGADKLLSESQTMEVVQRGQAVVENVQIAKLSRVMELLNQDILTDDQKRYYITIDRLDENWVSEDIRHNLIRALLEAARDFNNRVENVKIVIALREDLIERVFRLTRNSGYQEEKYRSLYLKLHWDKRQLEEMLDRRVTQLVKEQYTGQPVTLRKLLPERIEKSDPVDYIVERTLYRPRDVIAFFNQCMEEAQGKARISQEVLLKAESSYSLDRLRALADEWSSDYALLVELCFCMKHFPSHFVVGDIEDALVERLFKLLTKPEVQRAMDNHLLQKLAVALEAADIDSALSSYFRAMYRVGVIGVKPSEGTGVHWSFRGQSLVHMAEDARYHVHPVFHRVLSIVRPD